MIAETTARVRENTSDAVNEEIRRRTEGSVSCYASGGAEAIQRRLDQLDREWDIERMLEANAASLTLLAVIFGVTRSRKWFVLPGLIGGFLLQHALQGWCPPVPLLRRLGFRTEAEINRERYALKALRGDFQDVEAAQAVERQQNVAAALSAVDR
jgi:hypothetical protein